MAIEAINRPYFPIGLGSAALSGEGRGYGFGPISDSDSVELIHFALEQGINVIDCAPVYGFGLAEQRIGKALADSGKRQKTYLISKCGVTWGQNKRIDIDNRPKSIEHMLHQSLKDLKTDYIDLYLVHRPDQRHPLEETLEALVKFQAQGKIRAIGLSNFSFDQIIQARESFPITAVQNEVNMFCPGDTETLDLVGAQEIDFFSWGTFDKGILTGRVFEGRVFAPEDARSWAPWWKKSPVQIKVATTLDLENYALKNGFSLLEMALGFALKNQQVSSALCGFRTRQQLSDILNALENLPPGELIEDGFQLVSQRFRHYSSL